jgi:hypothetical protein
VKISLSGDAQAKIRSMAIDEKMPLVCGAFEVLNADSSQSDLLRAASAIVVNPEIPVAVQCARRLKDNCDCAERSRAESRAAGTRLNPEISNDEKLRDVAARVVAANDVISNA